MRRFNFARPLLLLAVAFFVYQVILLICSLLGVPEESATNYAMIGMIVAAIITFQRINRHKYKK